MKYSYNTLIPGGVVFDDEADIKLEFSFNERYEEPYSYEITECHVYGDVDAEVTLTDEQETEIVEWVIDNEIRKMLGVMYEQDRAAESAYYDEEYHRRKDEGLL